MAPADTYASNVTRSLVALGFRRDSASRLVQSEEKYVRKEFSAGVPAAYVAQQIASRARRAQGRKIAGLASGESEDQLVFDNGGFTGIDPDYFMLDTPGMVEQPARVPAGAVACQTEAENVPLFLNADQEHDLSPDHEISAGLETFNGLILKSSRQALFNKIKGQRLDTEDDARELAFARSEAKKKAEGARKRLSLIGSRNEVEAIKALAQVAKERKAEGLKLTKGHLEALRLEPQLKTLKKGVDEPARIEKQIKRVGWLEEAVHVIAETYPRAVATNKTNTTWQCRSAIFAEESGNEKIASKFPAQIKKTLPYKTRMVATTYAPIARACPRSCPLKHSPLAHPHVGGGFESAKDVFGNIKRGSCYAQTSNNILPIVIMLDGIADAFDLDVRDIALDEARAILAGYLDENGRSTWTRPTDIRLHTSGDTTTAEGARILGSAIKQLFARQKWVAVQPHKLAKYPSLREGTQRVVRTAISKLTQPAEAWTYTHAWERMSPRDWQPISCLASTMTVEETAKAYLRGWAPTIVVKAGTFAKHTMTSSGRTRAFTFDNDKNVVKILRSEKPVETIRHVKNVKTPTGSMKSIGKDIEKRVYLAKAVPASDGRGDRPIMWIPCPAQHPKKSMRVGCVNCRLCFNAQGLWERGMGIAFEAHGSGKESAVTYGTSEEHVAQMNELAAKDKKSLEAFARKVERFEGDR